MTLVAGVAIGLMIPAPAHAVAPGCDTAFMETMRQKAWMEAQREIMIAQTVIAKPDSVFALGCFGRFTSVAGSSGAFVQGTAYDYNTAVSALITGSFNHTYGGGHYTGLGANNGFAGAPCDKIAKLWDAARKADLNIPTPLLGTLESFATYNRGAFPSTAGPATGYGDTSNAGSPIGVFYGTKVASKSANAAFDDMKLFANITAPLSQAGGTCAAGIKTGVSIDIAGAPRPEIICPNPGCVSDGAAAPTCVAY